MTIGNLEISDILPVIYRFEVIKNNNNNDDAEMKKAGKVATKAQYFALFLFSASFKTNANAFYDDKLTSFHFSSSFEYSILGLGNSPLK